MGVEDASLTLHAVSKDLKAEAYMHKFYTWDFSSASDTVHLLSVSVICKLTPPSFYGWAATCHWTVSLTTGFLQCCYPPIRYTNKIIEHICGICCRIEWFDKSNFKLNMKSTKEMCVGGNKNTKPHPLSELLQINNQEEEQISTQFKLPLHWKRPDPLFRWGIRGGWLYEVFWC